MSSKLSPKGASTRCIRTTSTRTNEWCLSGSECMLGRAHLRRTIIITWQQKKSMLLDWASNGSYRWRQRQRPEIHFVADELLRLVSYRSTEFRCTIDLLPESVIFTCIYILPESTKSPNRLLYWLNAFPSIYWVSYCDHSLPNVSQARACLIQFPSTWMDLDLVCATGTCRGRWVTVFAICP